MVARFFLANSYRQRRLSLSRSSTMLALIVQATSIYIALRYMLLVFCFYIIIYSSNSVLRLDILLSHSGVNP
jgi:hypothetical protein